MVPAGQQSGLAGLEGKCSRNYSTRNSDVENSAMAPTVKQAVRKKIM